MPATIAVGWPHQVRPVVVRFLGCVHSNTIVVACDRRVCASKCAAATRHVLPQSRIALVREDKSSSIRLACKQVRHTPSHGPHADRNTSI